MVRELIFYIVLVVLGISYFVISDYLAQREYKRKMENLKKH